MHGLDLALGGGKERERIRLERFKARAEMDEQWLDFFTCIPVTT